MYIKSNKLFLLLIIGCIFINIKMEKLNASTYCEKEATCMCSCTSGIVGSVVTSDMSSPMTKKSCENTCNSFSASVETCVLNICDSGDTLENGKCIKVVDTVSCPTGYTYSNEKNHEDLEETNFGDTDFGGYDTSCAELLGKNMTKVISGLVTVLRIVGAIAVIVHGMILLIPAVVAKDADAFKNATGKCVKLLIVLAAIGLFPAIIRLIGAIFGYDISCIA